MKKEMETLIKRIALFFAGLLILAFGIAFSTVSGLGISPLNCLAFVIGELAGIQMGYVTMALYIVYVLLEIPIKGKNFRAADLLQVPVAIVFGFFVNWTKSAVSGFPCPGYAVRLLYTALSIVLIAAGTTIYVIPRLVYQAPEGLILAICGRWNLRFGHVKSGFDVTIVVIAFLVSMIFGGHVIGIREGTLLAAVGVGLMVSLFSRKLKPALERFCYGAENEGAKA